MTREESDTLVLILAVLEHLVIGKPADAKAFGPEITDAKGHLMRKHGYRPVPELPPLNPTPKPPPPKTDLAKELVGPRAPKEG